MMISYQLFYNEGMKGNGAIMYKDEDKKNYKKFISNLKKESRIPVTLIDNDFLQIILNFKDMRITDIQFKDEDNTDIQDFSLFLIDTEYKEKDLTSFFSTLRQFGNSEILSITLNNKNISFTINTKGILDITQTTNKDKVINIIKTILQRS